MKKDPVELAYQLLNRHPYRTWSAIVEMMVPTVPLEIAKEALADALYMMTLCDPDNPALLPF